MVEVFGYAAWSAFVDSSADWWREAIYALSATLLAGAWLLARAWGWSGVLASPIAGIASWFAVPQLTAVLYRQAEMRWGYGTGGQFIGYLAGYALGLLVISLPALALIASRRRRTTANPPRL
jgi:hypothetical protein